MQPIPPFPLLSLLFLTITIVPIATSTCFVSNGSAVYDWSTTSQSQPCSSDPTDPMSHICCATNRRNPSGGNFGEGHTADTCLPNGLCQNIGTNDAGELVYSYWRDYCTESDWKGGSCLDVCTGFGEASDDGTAIMTPCGDSWNTTTKWCCGRNNTACCWQSSDYQSVPLVFGENPSSTTASASSTGTTSPTSTPVSTSNPVTNLPTSNPSLSPAAKAGIGIGVAGGIIILAGLAIFLFFHHRRRKGNPHEVHHRGGGQSGSCPGEAQGSLPGYCDSHGEYTGATMPREIGGGEVHEVDGGGEKDGREGRGELVELA